MSLQHHSQNFIQNALGATISRQSFERWTQLYLETQRVIRDPEEYAARGRQSLLSAEDRDFMVELVCQEPSLFLDEMRERLYNTNGALISITGLHKVMVQKLMITLKRPNTVNIRKSLTAKFRWIAEMANVPAEFLVFTDESAICSHDLLHTFSRSRRGTTAVQYQRDANPPCFSLIPAISYYGVLKMTVTARTVKGRDFEHFLKWKLLPRMNRYPAPNSILVMDNAKIHRGPRVARLCREAGVKLVYLPTYCPELNPIKVCFSQVKSNLC